MDSFGFGNRNSSGQINTAYCSCGVYCAGGYWGTVGSARYTCPAGYQKTLDFPLSCVKARPVDAQMCPCRPGVQPGQPPAGEVAGAKQPTAGDPIDLSSGTLLQTLNLFSTTDGLLRFDLNYNSRSEFKGPVGWAWTPNIFGAYEIAYTYAWAQDPTGRTMYFKYIGGAWRPRKVDGTVYSTSTSVYRKDTAYTFGGNGSGKLMFTDERGIAYTFSYSGNVNNNKGVLEKVVHPDGYTQTYTITSGQVTQVQDSFGRAMTFSYHPNQLLASVTDPDGEVYKLEYVNTAGAVPTAVGSEQANTAYLGKVIMPDDTPLTDADNPTLAFHYDTIIGNFMELTGITDERGVRTATWDYDSGRPISSEGASGFNATDIAYDDANNITTVTTALGKETKYKHTLVNGVRKLTEIDGTASANAVASDTTYNLDVDGRITREILPEGQRTRYVRNARGLPTTIEYGETTAQSLTTTISWHATLPVPTQVVRPGLTIDLSVDSLGRILSRTMTDTTSHTVPYSTNGQTRTWTYTYLAGSNGKIASIDGPMAGSGDTIVYTYSAAGDLASVTDGNGLVSLINSVNGRGQPTSVTDPNGVTTTLEYSPRGWVTAITVAPGPGERTTALEYDVAGNLTKRTNPGGGWVAYAYSDEGLVEEVTTSDGETRTYTRDALGNITVDSASTGGGGALFSATAQYDELGRLLRAISASSQTTEIGYDRSDRLTSLTDPRSNQYDFAFDALNRATVATDPDGDSETSTYGAAGNVTTFSDGANVATSYVYNGFGEIIREVSPDRGTIDYWYDAGGRLVKRIDAEGQEVQFGYDNGGRPTAETFVGASGLNRSFTFDATAGGNFGKGRLTNVSDAHGSYSYIYNAFGELASETRILGSVTFLTAYDYDANGWLAKITYPSGRTVEFTRTGVGKAIAVKTRSAIAQPLINVLTNADYLPFGPLKSYDAGNGLNAIFTYDGSYQLTDIDVTDGGSANVLDLGLVYDAAGNLTAIADNLTSGRSNNYTYTDDNRLATAAGPYGARAWQYDGNGNRLEEIRTIGGVTDTEAYIYIASTNRLDEVRDGGTPVRSFDYNDNGNVVDDVSASGPEYDLHYDADGRLVQLDENSVLRATYKYDAFGRRIFRQTFGAGAQIRLYVYDPDGRPLAETDATGVVLKEFIWLNGVLVGSTTGSGSGSVLYYVHPGHLGQPLRMTSSSKWVVWDADLEPFGQASFVTAVIDQDLRLPGQWDQFEASLHQNWWRDYDPSLGRYLEADPIGLSGGSNIFGYAAQNPTGRTDPRGQDVIVANNTFWTIGPHLDHQGMYVGNNQTGWTFLEDPGQDRETDKQHGKTFKTENEVLEHARLTKGFTHFMEHDSTEEQDKIMARVADAHRMTDYNMASHNCGDLVHDALVAAGIPFPDTINPRDASFSASSSWSKETWQANGWSAGMSRSKPKPPPLLSPLPRNYSPAPPR